MDLELERVRELPGEVGAHPILPMRALERR
jgi:hypothetical protein